MAELTAERLFIALEVARGRMAQQEFVRFLTQYEMKIAPLLRPYGYKGCRLTEQATLQDFDTARKEWMKRQIEASRQPGVKTPDPIDEEAEARRQMWAVAASDPIASVVIGLGAIFAATLGKIFGFEQDPRKAAAAGQAISNIVTGVGSLNTPHQVNEMVQNTEAIKDKIKTVEGDNVRKADPGFGARNVNTGATAVQNKNCGQCTGAVLEGIGGTSTSFSIRAFFPEGFTPSPMNLQRQFQVAGNLTGTITRATSMSDLMLQLKQYPVGTNVALLYKRPDGTGHVICAFVGKGKELLFVDAQSKPPQVIPGPDSGVEFHHFPVTPKQR